MARDLEEWVVKAVGTVKTGLNGRITALNNDKNDDVVMATVDASAFYYQDWGQGYANHTPAVLFSVQPVTNTTTGQEADTRVRLLIEMHVSDKGLAGSEKLMKLLMRYRRAIHETLLAAWNDYPGQRLVDLPDVALAEQVGTNHYLLGVGMEFTFV